MHGPPAHDPTRAPPDPSELKHLARIDLPIDGMTCASCAERLGKLSKAPGVASASVNFATRVASAAMAFSSVSVVANSLCLRRAEHPHPRIAR